MRCVNEGSELFLCTVSEIRLGVVEYIVAVIRIVRKAVAVACNAVAVDLLIRSGQPYSVYAEIVELARVDLIRDALEVAAEEGASLVVAYVLSVVLTSAVSMVV